MKKELKNNMNLDKQFEEQVFKNYEFYKSAFELSKEPKLILEDCVIVRFNIATMGFFKCEDPLDLFNHNLSEFVQIADKKDLLSKTCEGNILLETDLKLCNGEIVQVTISFDTISKNGKQRTIASIYNMDELIKMKRELDDVNVLIKNVIERAPIGISVKNIEDKKLKYMNPMFSVVWGWPKDIVANYNLFFELAFGARAEELKDLIMNKLKSDKEAEWKAVPSHDKNGNLKLIDITMFYLEDQKDMVTMVKDVTQEKKDRAWLTVKSNIIKEIPHGVVITDIEGNIVWVNKAFTKEYGYTIDEVQGQTPRILKSGIHPEEFYKEIWDKLKSGQVWKGKIYNKRKNGECFWDLQTISPITGENGVISNYVAIKNLTKEELDYNVNL